MRYNPTYRAAMCAMAMFLLAVASVLYFVPGILEGKSRFWVVAVKIGWVGIAAVAILAPLQAFREFAIVSDEGLLKSSIRGSRTRLDWKEIARVRTKPGENEILFEGNSGTKLKMSLCYDGWEDFRELAAKYLRPELVFAVTRALVEEDGAKARKS